MSRKIRTEAVDFLFDAVLSLKNREECYTFFEIENWIKSNFHRKRINTNSSRRKSLS